MEFASPKAQQKKPCPDGRAFSVNTHAAHSTQRYIAKVGGP